MVAVILVYNIHTPVFGAYTVLCNFKDINIRLWALSVDDD